MGKTNEELFEIIRMEKEGQLNKPDGLKYGCFNLLAHKPFWFSIGYGHDGLSQLGGNCYEWSNAFSIEDPTEKEVMTVLNMHDEFSLQEVQKILRLCKKHQNRLFFCKEDHHSQMFYTLKEREHDGKLVWHYFPNQVNSLVKERYKDCSEVELFFRAKKEKEAITKIENILFELSETERDNVIDKLF